MPRNGFSRLFLTLSTIVALGASSALAAVHDRIGRPVSDGDRVAIPNSVSSRIRAAKDLGPAPSDTPMQAMTLRFSMTSAQQAALDQLLMDQQDPTSPRYHRWLTPAQFAAQFGLSSNDIAKVTDWLTSQGLTVTGVANSATFVTFNGTVAQVQSAFGTSIHTLSTNGATNFANVVDPTLPGAIADVVMGITGLHNFRIQPRIHSRTVADPRFTSSVTANHYVAPGDFYTIYNETPLLNTLVNGTGVTIAIMGQVDISTSDIAAFRAAAGISASVPTTVHENADPGTARSCTKCSPSQDDLNESSLDIEWAGAVAPGAAILFVNGPDVFNDALTQAVDRNVAPILSISYGNCEASFGTSEMNTFNQLFKQANAQGQTVVAPAGDEGATDCDGGAVASQGTAVDFPASSPYVTAMGGSMFNEGSGSYWSASDTTFSAGPVVPAADLSALSYIPEAVWNENATGAPAAGGGGLSAFFPKPYWQVGTPADASRDLPDLSLNSAAVHDGYLYCVGGSCAVGFRVDSGGNLTVAGGTSFATPTFAGILALVEQRSGRIGNANPTIYSIANNSKYYTAGANTLTNPAVAFNDITTGNNSSTCTGGSPNCPNGGLEGFTAVNGYDLATGWGSVNAANFVNAWPLVTAIPSSGPAGTGISSTTVTASPANVSAGATVTLTATVTGTGSATPTGTVQFLVNNATKGAPVTLIAGTATYSLVTSCLNIGQQVIQASYSGDAVYAGSKGAGIAAGQFNSSLSTATPVEVQVTSGSCPDFSITPAQATVTIPSGGASTVSLSVAPINGFTGTVTFTASATETSSFSPGFSFNPATVTINSSSPASTVLTLTGVVADGRTPTRPGTERAPWYVAGSGATLASLLMLVLPRRRRMAGLLLAVLSIALIGGATGCGGSSGLVSGSNANIYVGTYTVAVTGTYTSASTGQVISHSTTVNFVVQ